MDLDQDARRLIERIHVLRQPCDLDLLVFFARHPRSLLTSEQLAAFLGYGVKAIAASLDLLQEAGLITRSANPSHGAWLYVFRVDGPGGGWLPALRQLASTREGRLALIWALRRRSSEHTGGPDAGVERNATTEPHPRPFLVRKVAGDR